MARANASTPNSAGGAAAPSQSAYSRRRLYALLGVLLLVLGAAVAVWGYQFLNRVSLPEPPQVDLAGADPEVAEALETVRAAVLHEPRSPDAWGRLGMTLHAHSYRTEAVVCYAAAEALDPRNAYWPYLHGVVLQSSPDPASAIPFLERAATLSEPNSVPRLALADLLLELNRLDDSAKHYQIVLKADSRTPHAQLGLGQVAIAQQKYKEALQYLDAIADNPLTRKRAGALRALAYRQLGDIAAAEREQGRSAGLPPDPSRPDPGLDQVRQMQVGLRARLEQASALGSAGYLDQAVGVLRETVQRYPQSDQAAAALGKALIFKKDFAGADRWLGESVTRAPDNADHWFYSAYSKQVQQRFAEAARDYREVLKRRPTDAQSHCNLGVCLLESNDRAGAAAAFRAALRYRPDLAEARKHLADLEKKQP